MATQEPEATATLADLPVGGLGTVIRVLGQGPWADRLRELGVTPGTQIMLARKAPLGDPLVFTLRGYQLALRRSQASQVEIRPQ